jgi:hypothetical protein
VHARFANVPPYDYRSTSRSDRAGERFAENYGEHDGAMRDYVHRAYRRHHRYSSESGRAYGEGSSGYDEDGYGEGSYAEGPGDDYSGGSAAMSINSPAALDPWNGYEVKCPHWDEPQ